MHGFQINCTTREHLFSNLMSVGFLSAKWLGKEGKGRVARAGGSSDVRGQIYTVSGHAGVPVGNIPYMEWLRNTDMPES